MSVRVLCPHCRTPCLVAEQHLGVPVKCGRCGRSFATRTDTAVQSLRLDLGAASSGYRGGSGAEDGFFVQHVVSCSLDQRHELGVLAIAGDRRLDVLAVLAPLLSKFHTGASPDASVAAQSIAAACKNQTAPAAIAVIWDGRVSIGGVGDRRLYHQSCGHLTRLRLEAVKLARNDWLVLAGDGSYCPLDEIVLKQEMAAAIPSAVALAERLVQRGSRTILAVRCY